MHTAETFFLVEYLDMAEPNFTAMEGEELLKQLQEFCIAQGASDIHVSPQKDAVRLEWRLHGVLQALGMITSARYADFLRRVKFEAKLKLNLTNTPQDGQYTIENGEGESRRFVNVRVATLPSRFGEALALRLLDPRRGILPLESLGFPAAIRDTLLRLSQLPNGLVLVTGPTGSGKTTTLYSLLHTMIGKSRNIITLEDPVEYELPGIVQSEIDTEHGYTFAQGLRSILRHDPDVILVGEIRDRETAQTAIDAALTGHLVLSTLHTNSAIDAIPRLLSMGVNAYTLAPALRAVLGQRLVRTLRPECRTDDACDPSANQSYGGQTCLSELLVLSPAIEQIIVEGGQTAAIEEQAAKEGFKTMRAWGEDMLRSRITTSAELARVTQ